MITIGIIVLTAIISLAAFNNASIFHKLCMNPYVMHNSKNEKYRFFTVAFVHADFGHLLFNMLTLFFFGYNLENGILGSTLYLLLYASSIVASGVVDFQNHKNNSNYISCGASGAVSAVMFANVLYNPWGVVYIKFVIPIYFILFAVGYLIYSLYMSKKANDNIAHNVHLWGALYGLAFMLIVKPGSLTVFLNEVIYPPFLK